MSTRAIRALVQIMQDINVPIRRRIEASEGLLAYEAPQDVVEVAKEFLAEVFENTEQFVDDRLNALSLMRKFEAPKIAQSTTRVPAREGRDRKEAWRSFELFERRMKYIAMTHRLPPIGWDSDLLSEDYEPPEGWPPTDSGFDGMADRVAERRRSLRVVEGDKPKG